MLRARSKGGEACCSSSPDQVDEHALGPVVSGVARCGTTEDTVSCNSGPGLDVGTLTNRNAVELHGSTETVGQGDDERTVCSAVGAKAVVDVDERARLAGCHSEECHGR